MSGPGGVHLLPLIVAVALTVSPATAGGDHGEPSDEGIVEEVRISATVAEARKDAVALTELDGEAIEDLNRGQDLAMLLGETPNAYAYSDAGNGVGYSYLRLRGFDQRRVAVYVDGVPLNTPESHQVFFIDHADFGGGLEGVQVQRGTASSLHGAPSVAGVVNLEPADLDATPGGEVKADVGSWGTSRVSLRYGSGFADGRWAWMVRAAHVESDGYRKPSWTRHTFAHLSVQRFSAESVLRVDLFGGPEKTQLSYFGVTRDMLDDDDLRRVNFLRDGENDSFVQPHLHVHYDRRLGDGVFLKNTAYVIAGNGFFRQYSDSLCHDPQGLFADPAACPAERSVAGAWRKRRIDERQVGWIPTVVWDHGRGTLTGGLHVRFHRGRHDGHVVEGEVEGAPLDAPLRLYGYENRKRSYVAFVRESLRLAENVRLTMELQATRHEYAMRDDDARDLSFDASYDWLTPRVGVNWNIDDAWNAWASASTGRSEPAFRDVWDVQDPYVDAASLFARFDPARGRYEDPSATTEKVRTVEAGGGWESGPNRVRASVYRMDFRDELVFAGGIDDDGNPITQNAGRSWHRGIEIEAAFRLPGEFDVSGFVAWSDDVLRSFQQTLAGSAGTVSEDYSGNAVALFPDHLVRVDVARSFGPVRVRLGARRVGTIYLDNSENERKNPARRAGPGWIEKEIEPFAVADALVTWNLSRRLASERRSLTLEARVENLFDERYAQFGYAYPVDGFDAFYVEFFPGAPRSAYAGVTFGF